MQLPAANIRIYYLKLECHVVSHFVRLSVVMQASRYLSGGAGSWGKAMPMHVHSIASPVACMGKGKGYNHVRAANAVSRQQVAQL